MVDGRIPDGVDLAEVAGRFGALLHAAGIPATPATAGRFATAVRLAAPTKVGELYWLARVTMLTDRSQLAVFDTVFDRVFNGRFDAVAGVVRNPEVPLPAHRPPRAPATATRPSREGGESRGRAPYGDAPASNGRSATALRMTSSNVERLRQQSFAACTSAELEQLRDLVAKLRVVPPRRLGRRMRNTAHGRSIDLRTSLRDARRTGGDPVKLARRSRRSRQRRVVLIADVSGSMEAYGRTYLYVLRGAVHSIGAEAFVFATRLHRLTKVLARGEPSVVMAKAVASAPDWSGGTRIGETLRAFNDEWGRRGVARGAVVVIVSDGWDAGEPALVGREMERLSRLAHRIVWVNPRRQSVDYEPKAAGMAAALPFVDAFVSGHSLDALDEVLAAIAEP